MPACLIWVQAPAPISRARRSRRLTTCRSWSRLHSKHLGWCRFKSIRTISMLIRVRNTWARHARKGSRNFSRKTTRRWSVSERERFSGSSGAGQNWLEWPVLGSSRKDRRPIELLPGDFLKIVLRSGRSLHRRTLPSGEGRLGPVHLLEGPLHFARRARERCSGIVQPSIVVARVSSDNFERVARRSETALDRRLVPRLREIRELLRGQGWGMMQAFPRCAVKKISFS